MKFIFFLFLFFSCAACSQQPRKNFIPKEFEYPDDKIGKGKIFVYQNIGTKEMWFMEVKMVAMNGKYFRSVKNYNSEVAVDSSLSDKGKLVEHYYFQMPGDKSIIKAQNLQDTIISDNSKLGKQIRKWEFIGRTNSLTSVVEFTYVKDTIITRKNKKLDCLVLQSIIRTVVEKSIVLTGSDTAQVFSNYYFAKELGLVKVFSEVIDPFGKSHHEDLELVEIKDSRL